MLNDNNFFSGGEGTGFYPKEIEQSLRFNDDDSAYLSWTPASAGNRKTWTFSTWVKRGNTGGTQALFVSRSTDNNSMQLRFNSNDTLALYGSWNGSSYDYQLVTNAVYRDVGAWYHVVAQYDSPNTAVKLYVNGEQVTSFSASTSPSLNFDSYVNNTNPHYLSNFNSSYYLDGYLAETHFIDGTAYDATAFGEFKNGVWVAKTPDVVYGANGFYLPYRNDYTVEGFSAVTYRGTSVTNYIGGVGFEPDLVWIKNRGTTNPHNICDSVRGAGYVLASDMTNAEVDNTAYFTGFTSDGFTLDLGGGNTNKVNNNYVAWCWDAGTGSPVSNTDGSITSTVKANPDRGFSIVSYTGTGSAANTDTVGHGLTQKPDLYILKNRSAANSWLVRTDLIDGSSDFMLLDGTAAKADSAVNYADSSVFSLGSSIGDNGNGNAHIAYCFHSVSGYSKMGSYTGTGASGNTVTTGFKPAFVMVKCATGGTGGWYIWDSSRSPTNSRNDVIQVNTSDAETVDSSTYDLDFTDTGFTIQNTSNNQNASGRTYIYMAFADTREAAFWLDDSGNNNDWENNGLTESDISLDSPTNNFATYSPIDTDAATIAEGNLKVNMTTGGLGITRATMAVSSGKWYWENVITGTSQRETLGIALTTLPVTSNPASTSGMILTYGNSGNIYYNGSDQGAYMATYGNGDVIGIALDLDSGSITYYKNGVSQGVGYSSIPAGTYAPFFGDPSGTYATGAIGNFGQDSSFAGNKVPQGYTDANGRGDFHYAPPAGYLALCTANLPEPAIGPNSASTSDEHFNTVLYTGNGTTNAITGVGFQPDFTWIKERSSGSGHRLFDALRGATQVLKSDATDAEVTNANTLTSFNADGFTVEDGGTVNESSQAYVAWNWKANGSGVSNTDGSITSTVSANVDAGFSIVSYTGNGTAGATVGHGLNSKPQWIFVKDRGNSINWNSYHEPLGQQFLVLNNTAAAAGGSDWPSMSDTTFGLANFNESNGSGRNYVAYCFHSVEGFSKFGSYTGNGSTDGPFVYTGFRPAFVMVKRTDSANWWNIFDSEREPTNDGVNFNYLQAEASNSENNNGSTLYPALDFLSNGFKLRYDGATQNASGGTYIYMAFAENPFKYSNAR